MLQVEEKERGERRSRREEKRGKFGGKEEEQDNTAEDIQDTDEQQRCIVSRSLSLNQSFVPF